MKVAPVRRLYGFGAILLVALLMCSRSFSAMGAPSFLFSLGVAGVAYLLAVRELFSTAVFPRHVVVIGLIMAALWHLPFLLALPGPDDDIHRYLWDGRVQRLGYNPYLVIPSDLAVSSLHTAETRTLNHPELPSPYPPGAELFFRAVTSIHESVFAMKLSFLLCEAAILLFLLEFLRGSERGAHWLLVYAWNPLLAIEVAGTGHIDIVGALLLVISIAALMRRWRTVAAIAFGLAIAVKFLPIVLLPLYWKRVRVRDAALAVLVVGLLYLPFLNHGRIPFGSFATYVQSFRFNDPVFGALERALAPQGAAAMAVLLGFVMSIWLRRKTLQLSAVSVAWPMAASLLCAPVIYPWYLLWMLPFLWSVPTVPITIWTVSIIPTYYVWYLRALGRPWLVPGWALLLEYGSIAVAAVVVSAMRLKRTAGA